MLGRQAIEHPRELIECAGIGRPAGGRERLGQLDLQRSDAPTAQAVAAGIHQDPREPGLHPLRVAQAVEAPPRGQDGVVRGLLGLARVAEDHGGQRIGAIEVRLEVAHERAFELPRVLPRERLPGRHGLLLWARNQTDYDGI